MLRRNGARFGLGGGERAATMVAGANRPRPNDTTTILAMGRPVGVVRDGVFSKRCRGSRHMLRRPVGWCLDVGSLDEAERVGASLVQIEDTESGRVYTASIKTIRDNGVPLDRGFGEQLLLPLDKWAVRDSRQMSLFGTEVA